MSTGLECNFIQFTPTEWFYLLENWDSPKGGWDWREYATAYGPFSTAAAAHKHLSDNHANPGGHSTTHHKDNACQHTNVERWQPHKGPEQVSCADCDAYFYNGAWNIGDFDGTTDPVLLGLIKDARESSARTTRSYERYGRPW